MHIEHHHEYAMSPTTVTHASQEVQWDKINTQQGPYEEFHPIQRTPLKKGDPVLFFRERTEDPNRKQYDLYVKYYYGNGTNRIWQEGANLYAKQCDRKVNEILQSQRKTNVS